MAVQKIEVWKTSDGQEFATEKEANEAEKEYLRRKLLTEAVASHEGYGNNLKIREAVAILMEFYDDIEQMVVGRLHDEGSLR